MSQPAPATVTISVAQLQTIFEEASALSVKVGLIFESCGVDVTRPVPTVIPADGSNVFQIADARSRRQAVQR